jgi:2-keto-4-pentenoate hydratase/2-oxohepta-3-ene-1,7-dioic acid hydratase in catechol pathway
VFVTSKECRDLSPKEAKNYILGYTVGNDLSCRLFQLPQNSAGQFFFAKAFDKFAPIGPTLISPEVFANGASCTAVTRVNGEVCQTADFVKDMIFSPETILSHMSQGKEPTCNGDQQTVLDAN